MNRSRGDKEFIPSQSYLIRLWPTKREGVSDYRVSLQDVATGDRQQFPDLKQFISFIKTQKDQSAFFHSGSSEPKASS